MDQAGNQTDRNETGQYPIELPRIGQNEERLEYKDVGREICQRKERHVGNFSIQFSPQIDSAAWLHLQAVDEEVENQPAE